jgi:hypothetical protein
MKEPRNPMVQLLMTVLGIIAAWDGFTTFTGTMAILSPQSATAIRIIIALMFALAISTFMLVSAFIWMDTKSDDFMGITLRILWTVSVVYDLYTSYWGNKYYVAGELTGHQEFLLVGMSLLVTGSPMLFSLLWRQKQDGQL